MKKVQLVICKNNPKHLIGYDDLTGFYCHQCPCGKDKNLELKKVKDNGRGEAVLGLRMKRMLQYVENGDKFEGEKQYEQA